MRGIGARSASSRPWPASSTSTLGRLFIIMARSRHHAEPPDVTLRVASRRRLFEFVERNQGVHQRAIARATHLSISTTLYHMDRLEVCGLVVARPDGRYKRYFTGHALAIAEKDRLVALRHAAPCRIIVALLGIVEATQRDLARILACSRSTISFELNHLLASGIVVREKGHPEGRYHLADPILMARIIATHGESLGIPSAHYPAEPAAPLAPSAAIRLPPVLAGGPPWGE